ncbi:MAG: MOSC domain-containing protein [Planctomycetes bacterium]|nr:MOSC domain-containing protein [Planctomycetota bacterium]
MPAAKIHSIQVSNGGVPKAAVASANITFSGVEGDRQRNLKYHGGRGRAVCIYSLEAITSLQKEGHPIAPGTAGENLTIEGLDWASLAPGARLRVGEAVELEITADTKPCATIAASFRDGNSKRIAYKKHPGESRWYARVLREGRVRAGDDVVLLN